MANKDTRKTLVSEEQLNEVLNFNRMLSRMDSAYMKSTPQLINSRMKDMNLLAGTIDFPGIAEKCPGKMLD